MAKIKKKGTSGNVKNFITRTQAVRKLQVSLPDFRRLCIFKGIYPREPRNKKKANKGSTASTTFYYTKDIQYLLHEPVLQKFREHKTFSKKLSKALGRRDYGDAKRLEEDHKPIVTLDHIIKERYPTFTDALRDLDDALSMLFLFANLPANRNLPSTTVATCQRLCNEWQNYVIHAGVLRKSFLSIKGIYYQAEVQGQDILWLVPYKFAQNVPVDVDFRIMHTFVEFYTTLLGFILFRLYAKKGLLYPPTFNAAADEKGAGLRAFKLENKRLGLAIEDSAIDQTQAPDRSNAHSLLGEKIARIKETDDVESPDIQHQEDIGDHIDTFKPIDMASADLLPQPHVSDWLVGRVDPSNLFAPFNFYLSRETPREPLEFLLRAFGCKKVGWDKILGDGAFTHNERDPSITHQVVDRPPTYPAPEQSTPVADAGHGGRVPGRVYVQPQYIWDCINAGQVISPAAYAPGALLPPHLSPWVKTSAGDYDPLAPMVDEVEGKVENDDEVDVETDRIDEGHDGATDEENIGHRNEPKNKAKEEKEEEERKEMQKMMMTKKKRKLYEKMVYDNKKKEGEAENLREKRRKVDNERNTKAGKPRHTTRT